MRKSMNARRGAQAMYQRAYRLQQKALRKPSRDDVARVALRWIIDAALRRDKEGELGKWSELVVKCLVQQGFDPNAARRRMDQLIEQYEDGWTFQRKAHLTRTRAE